MVGHDVRGGASIRLATPKDASAISSCFEIAYHGTYPISRVADSSLLRDGLAAGSIVFSVAETSEREIVGAAAMVPPAQGKCGDICHGAVLPAYRKLDLFTKLQLPLFDRAREIGLHVLLGRCVTAHPYSQRCMQSLGLVPVGLTLGAAPASLQFTAIKNEIPQRESFLDVAYLLARTRGPVRVYCSPAHKDFLARIYAATGLPVEIAIQRRGGTEARLDVVEDGELGTTTLRFGRSGAHSASDTGGIVEALAAGGAAAIYAELPLSPPDTAAAVSVLEDLGFSIAALLPERGDGDSDVLRLQRLLVDVEEEPITIDFVGGAAIKAAVFAGLSSAALVAAEER